MRFYTVEINQEEKVMVSFDGGASLYRLKDLGYDFKDMNVLIDEMTDTEMAKLKAMDPEKSGAVPVDPSQVKLLSPIVHPKQDMICLGINYDEHAKEADGFSSEAFGGERPYTIYFSKRVTRTSATGEPIPAYKGYVVGLDYESELGVILKDEIKGVSAEEAESHIFGYTVINDVSARNLQTRHKQWYMGKSLDGFTPMGPCIVTPDEIGDAKNLNIRSYVNGELRQNSNTRHMIQTVAGAISELSTGMTLCPGTIIATGTPAGVGMGFKPPKFLKHGDVVICEIQGIGRIENTVD